MGPFQPLNFFAWGWVHKAKLLVIVWGQFSLRNRHDITLIIFRFIPLLLLELLAPQPLELKSSYVGNRGKFFFVPDGEAQPKMKEAGLGPL